MICNANVYSDPFPLYMESMREEPVMVGDILAKLGVPSQADFRNTGRQVFTIFKNEDVVRILRNPALWTSGFTMTEGLGAYLGDQMLTGLDGKAHSELRGLLQPCFAPKLVKRWKEELVAPILRSEYIEPMRARGKADLVEEFGAGFPVRIVYAMMGFPNEPEAIAQFAEWGASVVALPQGDSEQVEQIVRAAVQAGQHLYDHVRPIVAERRIAGAQGSDLLSHLVQAEREGKQLDDHQITNIVRQLLPAAAETTTRTFANVVAMLFKHPDVLERVRKDRSLIGKLITETVRYEPVVTFNARMAAEDVVLRGVTIPAGATVSLCVPSACRDPDVYDDPHRFDIDRPFRPLLGFGWGTHTCLGMPIALMQIETALDALLDLPNLRLDPDMPEPEISGIMLRSPDTIHVCWDV